MRRIARLLVSLPLMLALATPAAGATVPGAGAWALVPEPPAFGEPTPGSVPEGPAMGSSFALASEMIDDGGLLAARGMGRRTDRPKKARSSEPDTTARPRRLGRVPQALSGERARLMLQSLTLPGWGQASLGQRRAALAFGVLEAGIWGSFTAFKIQQHMRQKTYVNTARLFAGIDLGSRDEEYRRIVGFYLSSEEYNRLVVRRDAANLHFGDPAAYDAYIAEHEIKGDDAWSWDSVESLLRYRSERQSTQRAIKHSHDALAAAVINRLLSLVHASAVGARKDAAQTSWKVECVPASGDPTIIHLGLRADF